MANDLMCHNLTDNEFISAYRDSSDPVILSAISRIEQAVDTIADQKQAIDGVFSDIDSAADGIAAALEKLGNV